MKRFLTCLVASSVMTLAAFAAGAEKGADPLKISHGAEVDIKEYLVKGKTTIVDFTSKYCPPCQAISPRLDALHKKSDDVAVVKVDINRADVKKIDWQSPVAKQYGLRSIPHFKIFDEKGELVAEGDAAYGKVEALLEKAEL
jgi:thiol-disulfide isomerase/thioredoxin